jgi:predicted regulator of Ras-like GTPase activity (Roadblock/LC7/MglB family)
MFFDEMVQKAVEETQGAVAALIMGSDGITLAHYVKPEAELEMEVLGVEYASILGEVRKVSGILESGEVREVTVSTDKYVVIVRAVTQEYFLALALEPSGNIGKGRFLLRVQTPSIRKELQ